jgi:hypothetical protein
MKVRVIRLSNNFYKDKAQKDIETKGQDSTRALDKYCCLGYFDALGVESINCSNRNWKENIRREVNRIAIDGLEGGCSRKIIICITNNNKRDEDFWEMAEKQPCLFVSLMRIRHENVEFATIENIVNEINSHSISTDCVIAYYTYDHSEIVLIRAGKSYLLGMKAVLGAYSFKSFNLFKMYTVFAIKEEELANCTNLKDEIVNCKLTAIIKNREAAKEFVNDLRNRLNDGSMPSGFSVSSYDTLGSTDLIIEILEVPLKQLLYIYKMGELLTHTNTQYQNAFFNVETQIFDRTGW